jgi:class 3 adenylate cyclase
MTQLQKQYQNLLTLLQSFESLWIYYTVSEGELYRLECKEEAKKLVDYFEIVYQVDKGVYIKMDEVNGERLFKDVLKGLDDWSTNNELFPKFAKVNEGDNFMKFLLAVSLLKCREYLCQKLKIEVMPAGIWSTNQSKYNKNEMRWTAHLPRQAIQLVSEDFVDSLSTSDSIVIVADIRKSQDLMTYGPSPDFFRDKILEFTTQIRRIIKDNFGIFDKFTGDGFLCYFNSYLCKQFDIDYYEQMLIACRQIMEFSNPFFEEWSKHVRKLPPNSCGLTIGIDSGVIKFRDLDSHLFAISDAIVWANRMSSAGKKEEIIFNNIPYFKVKESNSNVEFETIENITKGGEAFTAYKLIKM